MKVGAALSLPFRITSIERGFNVNDLALASESNLEGRIGHG